MSPQRSQAYRRVIKTLDDMGPSKLFDSEQQRIRYAADNLIFSTDLTTDVEACDALEDVAALCRALVESGRWEQGTAMRLVDDVCECGPVARCCSRPPSAHSRCRTLPRDQSRDGFRRLEVHRVTRAWDDARRPRR